MGLLITGDYIIEKSPHCEIINLILLDIINKQLTHREVYLFDELNRLLHSKMFNMELGVIILN
jgi:hypothetical protein